MKASAGKRILMLLENSAFPGDQRVRREALSLATAGFQVTVICPKSVVKAQPRREIYHNIDVYRYSAPFRADSFLGYLWEYGYAMVMTFFLSLTVFFRQGFDIIHAHNPPDTFVFIAAFYKIFGKRFVFDHHDLSPEMYYHARFGEGGSKKVYNILITLEKITFSLADHVISTNESYKKIAIERGRVPEENITVVRNGPDIDRLKLVEPDTELIKMGKTIIAYVGALGFQDGLDYLLRAFQHLIKDLNRSDFFCVVMGAGTALPRLRELATELELDDYVWLTGYVSDDDLVRYLSTADICVDPDPSNPFNDRSTMIKMAEYMALGKPIVAFDLPEHRVTAGDAAVYAQPNDEMDFARLLQVLMDNPMRRQSMSEIGLQRVETKLMWQHQEKHLIGVYEKLFELRN